MVHLIVNKT